MNIPPKAKRILVALVLFFTAVLLEVLAFTPVFASVQSVLVTLGAVIAVLDIQYYVLAEELEERLTHDSRERSKELAAALSKLDAVEVAWGGYAFTPTPNDNWGRAIEMAKRIQPRSIVYDVSSHKNIDEFDQLMLNRADQGATIYRLICFDPDDEAQSDRKAWFLSMIDESKDETNKYGALRERMASGSVFIYHVPQTSFADFFVCDYTGDGRHVEAIMGFSTVFNLAPKGFETYTSGLFVRNRDYANALKEFCRGFMIELARRHLSREEDVHDEYYGGTSAGAGPCFCLSYQDKIHKDRLGPRFEATPPSRE